MRPNGNGNFYKTAICITAVLTAMLLIKQWKNRTPVPTFPSPNTPVKPLTDYKITSLQDIPEDFRSWTNQVLTEAKEKLSLGEPCNQLWQHGNYRVRLVLSDELIPMKTGDMSVWVKGPALAIDGGKCPMLDHIVKSITKMAAHYKRPVGWCSNNSYIEGVSGVDRLVSVLQSQPSS